jgi:hypothetical protein
VRRLVLQAREGEPIRVPAAHYEELAREGERVASSLKLKLGGVTRLSGALKFENMIGSIATPRVVLELVPKTQPNQDWMRSVLALMDDRPIHLFDDAPASPSQWQSQFADLIARTFAKRLSNALAAEGTITTIEAAFFRSSMLSGRLRVGEWARRAAYDGHRFPIDRHILSSNNIYSQTLVFVGQVLAPFIDLPQARRQLLENLDTLSGGIEVSDAPSNAIGLELPEQWGAYDPAWTIAQFVLKQRSQFGRQSRPHGMSLVIEPWILLERLLERTLSSLAEQLTTDFGTSFASKPQRAVTFLSGAQLASDARHLVPDCVLLRNNSPLVNFEAKYRDYARTGAPLRTESYQAITAGRALGTRLAILAYPNDIPTKVLDVHKVGYPPEKLAIIGLDMFGYERGSGEKKRSQLIRSILENILGTCTLRDQGVKS